MSTRPTNRLFLFNRDAGELGRWKEHLLSKEDAFEVHSATSVTREELQHVAPDLIIFGRTPTAHEDEHADVLRSYLTVRPTKLLVVMAWKQLGDLEQAVQLGADDVLAPPFGPEEFNLRIDALLRT